MKHATPSNMNYAWAELMIRELSRLGIDSFYIAPGSRSSPLALSAAEFGRNVYTHFDERGVGFAALGHARATGRPAVMITTSGSAVANLWPAVCEASNDSVPLLIISADRPPELRDTGANQTMDQVKLFGGYVRWQVDLPCPDLHIPPEFVLSTVDHAVHRSMDRNPGPVHINQMFREPLAPVTLSDGAGVWSASLGRWWKNKRPWTLYPECPASPSTEAMTEINRRIKSARRGIVIAGAARHEAESKSMLQVAEKLGWPLLPDIRSGLRIRSAHPNIIQMADQLLVSEKFSKAMQPDLILHLGGRVTSKRIQQFIAAGDAEVVMINEIDARLDPDSRISVRLVCALAQAARRIMDKNTPSGAWLKKWKLTERAVIEEWKSEAKRISGITEPAIAEIISRELSPKHHLALASSMPIRDMDMYGLGSDESVQVVSNRGVSGIDGNLATAVGFANGSDRPVTLIIGDLALLHDLNSLALLKRVRQPVTLVVINNDGGGIFSFLPISQSPKHFEQCFGAPHGLEFSRAAEMFGIAYNLASDLDDFKRAYRTNIQSGKSSILEVRTNRVENYAEHRRIQAKLKKVIDHAI